MRCCSRLYDSFVDGDQYEHAVNELRGLFFTALVYQFEGFLKTKISQQQNIQLVLKDITTCAEIFVQAFILDGELGNCLRPVIHQKL